MIYNEITKKFKRQNWKEYFTVEISGVFVRGYEEGMMIPRFYLPVYQRTFKDSLELWIFPLAPLVLLLRIMESILWLIWKDLLTWERELNKFRRLKNSTQPKKR